MSNGMSDKKSAAWFVGDRHEDLINEIRQSRKTKQLMVTHALEKATKASAQPAKHSISQHELVARITEIFEDNYDEPFDAFTEIDVNNNGSLTKWEFCEGIRAILNTGPLRFGEKDLSDLFAAVDKDNNNAVSLKEFVDFFGKHKRRGSTSKARLGTKTGRQTKRPFDEVLVDCRDETGVERNFPVDPAISFQAFLEKLEGQFQRPVTMLYEQDGHLHTIKNANDLKECWDALEREYTASSKPMRGSAHLEAFAVNYNGALTQATGRGQTGRVTLSEQRASREGQRGSREDLRGSREGTGREAVESMAFAKKHKWIDNMMRNLGVPFEDEPPTMQGLWDVLESECKQLDPNSLGSVPLDSFRNALTRTEARMSADQVEWFVRDADKNEDCDVLYSEYVKAKKEARAVADRVSPHARAVKGAEDKISQALRQHFKSLKEAFKRMDTDRDGKIHPQDFRRGVEQRLKLHLTKAQLDAVISRASNSSDGYIHYQDFLERFKAPVGPVLDGASDALTDLEISRQLLQSHNNMVETFRGMDLDGDGLISTDEIHAALRKIGLQVSMARCEAFLAFFDLDDNHFVDYREFLRKVSQVDQKSLTRTRLDELSRVEDKVQKRMRERFDSAMQAFHVLDADSDGRLSIQDWLTGLGLLYTATPNEKPSVAEMERLHERADSSGSGFIAYHEFVSRFNIQPKPVAGLGPSLDVRIRQKLRDQYKNVTEAFLGLDHDGDNRLSLPDLRQGLAELDFDVTEEQARQLIERVAADSSEFIAYDEFLMHFGMEPKAEGRWEKVLDEKALGDADMTKEVELFRKHIAPSKWFGRGGILATLQRFDDNHNGRLERGEFVRAMRDGLGMKELSDAEVTLLLGKNMEKPYCHKPSPAGAQGGKGGVGEGTVDVQRFVQLFVDVYFEREKTLFDVLLVQNRWAALEEALAAFNKVAPGGEKGAQPKTVISKAEFGAAMQVLVRQGRLKESERQLIISKCVMDGCFKKEGLLVGCIDYDRDFLEKYIGDERRIHRRVSPRWEACKRKFERKGTALTYAEFRELCRNELSDIEPPLTEEEVEALIDVIDANGDGTIGLSEFVHRYAGDDAELLDSLRSHWHPLLSMLNAARPEGVKDFLLPRPKFQATLVSAIDSNILPGLTPEQVRHMMERMATSPAQNLPAERRDMDDKGNMLYLNWLKRYIGEYYDIHMAFQGMHPKDKMSRWDGVIWRMQDLDRCLGADGERHEVTWDHFRKVLRRAGIELSATQVSQLIDHQDPGMTGRVQWMDFVRGVGPDGVEKSAPYFLNGGADYDIRALLSTHWSDLLEVCKKVEKKLRKEKKDLLPPILGQGVLTKECMLESLKAAPLLKLADTNKDGKPKPHHLVTRIMEVATKGFGKREDVELKDKEGGVVVDYVGLCRKYAGEAFDAEEKFERRWEVVITVLKELGKTGGETALTREVFVERLTRPEMDLTDAMVDYLVKDQPAGSVDLDTICWRCGRPTIIKVLQKKWSTLMTLWRAKDTGHTGKLDSKTLRSCLDRADVGLSSLQVDILMNNIEVEPDGKYDYDKILSGKLKATSFGAEAYLGWTTMEAHWEQLAEGFWEFDVNVDGKVSPDEFTRALLQLKQPALSDKMVIEALIAELNPNGASEINFDLFSWRMAFNPLREAVQTRGRKLLEGFRAEAARLFSKHKGRLPKKEAEEVFGKLLKDAALRPMHFKILVNRSAEEDGLVTETLLAKVLRDLVGDKLGKAESEELRASFAEMQAAATFWAKEHWHEPGGKVAEAAKRVWGVACIGDDAVRGVGERPVRRHHMNYFFRDGGFLLPRGMEPSPALIAIKEARENKVYYSEQWKTFWELRARYRSPDIRPHSSAAGATPPTTASSHSTLPAPRPAAASAAPPPPAHASSSGPVPYVRSDRPLVNGGMGGKETEGVFWRGVGGEAVSVETRVKRAMADCYGTVEGALRALDEEGSGRVSMEAMRGAVEGLGLGLSAGEVSALLREADPHSEGFLLHREFASAFLPPPTDLRRLAHERAQAGVYQRLRSRLRGGAASDLLWPEGGGGGGGWGSGWHGTWGGAAMPGPLSPPATAHPASAAYHPPPLLPSHHPPAPLSRQGIAPGPHYHPPASRAPPHVPMRDPLPQSVAPREGPHAFVPPPSSLWPPHAPPMRDGGRADEMQQLYQNTIQQLNMLTGTQLPARGPQQT